MSTGGASVSCKENFCMRSWLHLLTYWPWLPMAASLRMSAELTPDLTAAEAPFCTSVALHAYLRLFLAVDEQTSTARNSDTLSRHVVSTSVALSCFMAHISSSQSLSGQVTAPAWAPPAPKASTINPKP